MMYCFITSICLKVDEITILKVFDMTILKVDDLTILAFMIFKKGRYSAWEIGGS